MPRPTTVVLATRNPGKLTEFRALLEPSGCHVEGLPREAGPDPAETGATYAENARIKALAASHSTGFPVLADDSGLEVFTLGRRPGVHSARYLGAAASDADRVRALLDELGRTAGPREARFVCALALAQAGSVLLEVEGECRGIIAHEPRGDSGFGYDPIFLIPDLGRTSAELSSNEKNALSHRARAVAALLEKLRPAP